MATILQTPFSDAFSKIFFNESFRFFIWISLKFVPKASIDKKKIALVQVMAWHQTGGKLIPEATLTHFTDVYMHYEGTMS